ncbi:MAG: energy-coupling factor transporter transmembrane protein EcfT [Coriobacteriia bacterium]|nr:energy-coupling factor transporter transmembrane protein EcfT [Coriobacteriia bacterium]
MSTSTSKSQAHKLAPQVKILAATVLVFGIVLSAPHTAFTVASIAGLVLLLGFIAQASIRKILLGSLVVLPIAVMISLFYPLRFVGEWQWASITAAYLAHWQPMLQLVITPWLCVMVMMLLAHTTTHAQMLFGLERLRLPRVLVMMLSFMYRYVDVMKNQLQAAHRALVSRAPTLSRRKQVLLYGNLAGSMLIRAYDRGELIHAAMLSRGFSGVLPVAQAPRIEVKDILLAAGATLFAAALIMMQL